MVWLMLVGTDLMVWLIVVGLVRWFVVCGMDWSDGLAFSVGNQSDT